MVNLMVRTPSGGVPVRIMQRALGGDVPLTLKLKGTTTEPSELIKDFLKSQPFYVAHRLGGTEYPEHTVQGMDAAIGRGFRAFEFSTYQTKDKVFVGSHDWTTERTTGVRHEIWDTTWETIQGLNQPAGKITRLEEIVSRLPVDGVLVIDHKATSASDNPNSGNLSSEKQLFEQLEKLFPEPTERVIWKCFAAASSADRARARGYRVMCMLYSNELPTADFSRWDILGLEWNATQEAWNTIKSAGKPTIAHIITNKNQATTAISKGAHGLMSSVPGTVHP